MPADDLERRARELLNDVIDPLGNGSLNAIRAALAEAHAAGRRAGLEEATAARETCIVCKASLNVNSYPPHCLDCTPTDAQIEAWEDGDV